MINLFFSYSHKDEALINELDKHLSMLKRNGFIHAWHDRCILAGSEVDKEINVNLMKADIILLLISPDFLASNYCYDKEMKFAMEKHSKGEAVVMPVILRPCDWHDTEFGKLLATPTDGKPVVKFTTIDDAFLEITNQIKKSIKSLQKNTSHTENTESSNNLVKNVQNPRSSNLRIRKSFSDQDRDQFLDDVFDYIANYFEASLNELNSRNAGIDSRFKRIDSQTFTAQIYVNGQVKSEAMIYYEVGSFSAHSIIFSRSITSGRNSYNESLHIGDDGYTLFFTLSPIGQVLSGWNRNKVNDKLTNEGAAENLWEMLIQNLQ